MTIYILLLFWIGFLVIHHRYYWRATLATNIKFTGSELIAHRGLKNNAPENTIQAYLDAVDDNFSWIELDVLSTNDRVVVCSHNFELERKTEGTGYIHKMNFKDIDVPLINSDNSVYAYYKIPTLSDVLEKIPNYIGLNIEIKTCSVFDFSTSRAIGGLVEKFRGRPVVLSSFNPLVVLFFRVFYREVPVGFLLESNIHFWLTNWIHPNLLIPRADMLNEKLFKYCKEKHLPILTWTVNNLHAINWCKNHNVSGIITDLKRTI